MWYYYIFDVVSILTYLPEAKLPVTLHFGSILWQEFLMQNIN